MNKYKIFCRVFLAAALVLSHVMCVVVSALYMDHLWTEKIYLTSAPAYVVLLVFAPPFMAGILVCLGLAWWMHRNSKP